MYNELVKVVDFLAEFDNTAELSSVSRETLDFICDARALVDRYRALDNGKL
jgi:hypothetical protein